MQTNLDDGLWKSESAWNSFGKFIHQFQPETKTLTRKLEQILIKLYKQNVSLLFNQTCLNEILLLNHTHTHTYIYIYIYIYNVNYWLNFFRGWIYCEYH